MLVGIVDGVEYVHQGIAAKCTDTQAPAKDGSIHSN